jgi:hypothetical protein
MGSAGADQLPKDFLGNWCGHSATLEGQFWKDPEDCQDKGKITITSKKLKGFEYECDFVSVKTVFDPTVPASTHTFGTLVSRIVAKCWVEGTAKQSMFSIYKYKTSLQIEDEDNKYCAENQTRYCLDEKTCKDFVIRTCQPK